MLGLNSFYRIIIITVQLRGKVTLTSESHACARAYTHECSSCHSRAFLERARVLHSSLDCHMRLLDRSLHSTLARGGLAHADRTAHARTVCTLDSTRPPSPQSRGGTTSRASEINKFMSLLSMVLPIENLSIHGLVKDVDSARAECIYLAFKKRPRTLAYLV